MSTHTVYKIGEPVHALTGVKMPPIIAIGGGMTLVAVLHLLHRAKIATYAVCPEGDFAVHSRFYRPLPGRFPYLAPRDLPRLLTNLPFESAVLLPCSDDWLSAVADLSKDLASRFPSSLASAAVEALVNKWHFAQILQREGLPHPKTRLITSTKQTDSMPNEDFQGRLLKPLFSEHFARKYGVKGFLVDSRAEVLHSMKRLSLPILLQEFIPGPATAHYFLDGFIDRQGRTCALFARRRLRMSPPKLGNSTFMLSIPLEEVAGAVATLQSLLKTVSYRGIFSAEFKCDDRDGFFKMLEINARPWWYVEAPACVGMDVCSMAYHDALGLTVEPVASYKAGQYLGILPVDFRAWHQERQQGGPGFWYWLRSWRRVKSTPFHWDDPLPALAYMSQQLSDYMRTQRTGPCGP
jgi:predicted ATP-grasp superfamily ATP-dependent carboligase